MPQMPSTQRRKRERPRSIAWICATAFTFLWGSVILWAHYYASTHTRASPLPNNALEVAQPKEVRIEKAAESPWYGWQPKISATMECDWMTCLQEQHPKCTTCRDEDLGPAPAVPVGWKPDVTVLHRMLLEGKDKEGNSWPPSLPKELCQPFGKNDINKNLFDQVPLSLQQSTTNKQLPKLFCGIYTMAEAHHKTIRAMRETWAPRCDGFLAFSTASDPRIPAMAIEHDGKEEYNNMWQKSRAIWKYIGDHYLDDYDYFFLGGEDMFVIPENLKAYLATLGSSEDDHFVGRRFKGYGPNNYFNSGGAGYVLSRGTLRKYVTVGFAHPDCAPQRHTSMEDVMIAECFRKAFKIGLTDTRDDQGRERFHPFAPGSHLIWKHPEPGKHDWYEDYNKEWGLKLGKDCCAPDSVSFHYIKKAAMVRHLHAMLHHCNNQ